MRLWFWRLVMQLAWAHCDTAEDFAEWAQVQYGNEAQRLRRFE